MESNGTAQSLPEEVIRKLPALPPPAGVVPSFVNPPNDNVLAIAVIAICVAIATVAGLLRAYTRLYCIKKVKLEDYLGLLSFAFYIGATGILIRISFEPGIFVHQYDLYLWNLERFIYLYVFCTILYCFTLMFIKAAMIVEWIRIFVPAYAHNTFWWICCAMIVANSALYVATIITINLICIPRERIWRRWLPGTCININAFNIFIAGFNLIFDILILLLPHHIIWKLALTPKQKIGVSFVFSVGVFACIAAAGRVSSAINMSSTRDTTFSYSRHLVWGLAEITSALLVFCVPAIPLAFRESSPMRHYYGTLREKARLLVDFRRRSLNRGASSSWPNDTSRDASIHEWTENSQVHLKRLGVGGESSACSNAHRAIQDPNGDGTGDFEGNAIYGRMGIIRTTEIQITRTEVVSDLPATDPPKERSFLW